MYALPVSGVSVDLRPPNGHDELALAETYSATPLVLVSVVQRLAPPLQPGRSWRDLPYADVLPALLALRCRLHGDRIVAAVNCPSCGASGDLELSGTDYLAAHAPKPLPSRIKRTGPTAGEVVDTVAEHGAAAPAVLLEGLGLGSRAKSQRAQRDLEAVAPALCGEVEGPCPECESQIRAWFDPGEFVVTELRQRARSALDDVDLLASAYGWSEEAILSLPRGRRAAYVHRIRARAS